MYSKQDFCYSDPIWIHISLWIDCLAEKLKLQYFSLAFIASLFRVTDENVLFEADLSGPFPFFRIFSLLLMKLIFISL